MGWTRGGGSVLQTSPQHPSCTPLFTKEETDLEVWNVWPEVLGSLAPLGSARIPFFHTFSVRRRLRGPLHPTRSPRPGAWHTGPLPYLLKYCAEQEL